jgi:hypothetical protein
LNVTIEEKRKRNSVAVLKYRAKNPEKWKETYTTSNRKRVLSENNKEASKKWAKEHPEKTRLYWRRYGKKRRSSPTGKINCNISNAIYQTIREIKNYRGWQSLVGYTLAELKSHLEKQFTEGMSWENYGEWHIDHIIPISAHNFKTEKDIDFKKCWALSNLRPLWARENIIKKDKLKIPFQPSLLIMEVAA